ncbi:MAG: enoyl-CoA hydratase-related protein, partial [Bacteroidota bacterium]
MNYEAFQVEIKDYIATVTFDRPEKSNALHLKAWEEMKHIFDTMSDDPTVRVIILAGSGKNFCAGIDLSLLMDLTRYTDISCEGRKREEIRKSIQFLQDSINAIEHCRKPVIAAIHRACIGGAVDIVSACDMRYCSDDAYFCIKEVDMGLVADIGTLQ